SFASHHLLFFPLYPAPLPAVKQESAAKGSAFLFGSAARTSCYSAGSARRRASSAAASSGKTGDQRRKRRPSIMRR
ncbi:RNHCP domain-containing protein, partial [Dysosmobacter welbionis]